ncbi:uncharacterized protein SCDLUD_003486 [Saccharomycodes ludwigii]|uniref:uncharacterized protein n=1 Tax=Saccharomycodes ludwigii TaxID=36035 RepID=UPI001E89EC99|nr:hypothetical protein SCDLUD_003486 [Saccharomycodes ludwigii]KAH3900500.1 hypothetical protein SCDLUD_003486 [Saccharomycodes ludwigii]
MFHKEKYKTSTPTLKLQSTPNLAQSNPSTAKPKIKCYKTIILGPQKSGKSVFLSKLSNGFFEEVHYPTNSERFSTFNIDLPINGYDCYNSNNNSLGEATDKVTLHNDNSLIYFEILDTHGISMGEYKEHLCLRSNASNITNSILPGRYNIILDYEFWRQQQFLGCFVMFNVNNVDELKLTYEYILPTLLDSGVDSNKLDSSSKLCCVVISNNNNHRCEYFDQEQLELCKELLIRIKGFLTKFAYCDYVELNVKDDDVTKLQMPLIRLGEIIERRKGFTRKISSSNDTIQIHRNECIIQ